MVRSAALATFLALFLALFSLASWGKAEINDPQQFAERSRVALESAEVRRLLTERISSEIWSRVDLRESIRSALSLEQPSFAEGAALDAADFAAKAALSTVISKALQEKFVQDLWQESVRVTYSNALRNIQGKNSALIVEKETVSLDLSALLQTLSRKISLPDIIQNNIPPGLGEIELGKVETVSRVQAAYEVIDLSPTPLLLLSFLLFLLIIIVNRESLWRAALWISGASFLGGLLVLLSKGLVPTFLLRGIEDPLSEAIANALWSEWSAAIDSSAWILFLAGTLFLLTSPLLSPILARQRALWKKSLSAAWKK